jgi:hypothetical protein
VSWRFIVFALAGRPSATVRARRGAPRLSPP